MKLSEIQQYKPFDTGFLTWDLNLGGVPRGHFHEISGRPNSGKTTFAQCVVGRVQRNNPDVNILWFDTEGNFDPEYAIACGIVEENLDVILDNDCTRVLQSAYEFIVANNKKSKPSFVVIDSFAGLTSEQEVKKGVEGATVGVQARDLNKFLRISTLPVKENGSVVWINNQLRDNLNSMFGGTVTPGGKGLEHWSNLRVKLFNTSDKVKQGEAVVGVGVNFTVEKIKSLSSYIGYSFVLPLIYGKGFSKEFDLIQMASELGVVNHPNNVTYEFGEYKFRGKMAFYDALMADKELFDAIYGEIKS